jgi:3-hydroxyacyl-[acyl-carrier-protein] dehydratase
MRWMWIDQIVTYSPPSPEAQGKLIAVKNISLSEEHLHDHFPADAQHDAEPIMPASLMIEGMAQTAGILVGSVHGFREKVVLAKIVSARFERDVVAGETIRYEARLERIDALGASTTGTVQRMHHTGPAEERGQWLTIGEVELLFSHLDQNMAGLEFPEENFVFSDNFRTILRSAGLEKLIRA